MIRRPCPAVAAALAALAVVLAVPWPAPAAAAARPEAPPAPPPAAAAELSVEVRDAAGAPLAEVAAEELVVRQAGEARPVLSLAPETRPWRLLLYFDAALAARSTMPRAAAALEAAAPGLVALGEVEVVVADDGGVRQVLPPTRDPDGLAAALARLSVFARGEDRLVELRRPLARQEEAAGGGEARGEAAAGDAGTGGPGAEVAALEVATVRERLDLLLERLAAPWAGEADGPAAVFWVGDGYDLDPAAWRRAADDEPPPAAPGPLADATAATARAATALGWTVVPVALRAEIFADDPTRWGAAPFELPSGETRVLPSYRLPRRRTAAERASEAVAAAEPPAPVPVAPAEPLAAFAAASGGYLAGSAAEVAEVVDRLAARLRLRYAAPPEDGGEPAPLVVEIAGEGAPDGPGEGGEGGEAGGGEVAERAGAEAAGGAGGGEAGASSGVASPARPARRGGGTGATGTDRPSRRSPPVAPGEDGAGRAAGAVAEEAAGGRSVVARRWSASALPPAVSALRARRLLDGALDPGAVEVRAAVAVAAYGSAGEAALEIEVDPPLAGDELRLTLAALDEDGRPRVEHRRVPARPGRPAGDVPLPIPLPPVAAVDPGAGAAPTAGAGPSPDAAAGPPPAGGSPSGSSPTAAAAGASTAAPAPSSPPGGPAPGPAPSAAPPAAWTWRGTVALPPGAERVAVLVEDPASGAWGGTLAGVVDLSLDAGSVWDAAAGVLPGPGAVRLLRPEGAMLAGRVRFETVVAPAVARVDFRLDGRRVAAAAAAPFAAVVDLGRLPLPRRVEAVAFDAAGGELGRDETVVNGGAGRLRVRLVEPASARAVGAVTVAVDVAVPEGRRLERVDLFWQERRVATLYRPPFRHRLEVRPESAQGLLRAVARMADGGEAEDAVVLNGPGPAERLDVSLTELYVVVTGGDGRPVRGLGRGDFTVREEGRPQPIATFGDAADLPLTLGLALDTSASMFVKLPAVRDAALGVLDDLVPGRDQAFLVEFSDRARLAAGPTRDLETLRSTAAGFDPGGRTSLWEAVVYSLVQLQGAAGRRALLVYSDGADEDGDVSYRTALAFARRVGVPVYAIVANDESARLGGFAASVLPSLGGRIERLAEATGGRAWVVRRNADLGAIYAEVRAELAAQYRLGYYAPPAADDGGWRRVTVDVRRPGARARTVSGYRR